MKQSWIKKWINEAKMNWNELKLFFHAFFCLSSYFTFSSQMFTLLFSVYILLFSLPSAEKYVSLFLIKWKKKPFQNWTWRKDADWCDGWADCGRLGFVRALDLGVLWPEDRAENGLFFHFFTQNKLPCKN